MINETIKKVTEDIESLKMNTAVSGMMILTNALSKQEKISREHYEILLKLLSPFAPHITEEIWHDLSNPGSRAKHTTGGKNSIHLSPWPKFKKIKTNKKIKIAIQINSKVRATLEIKGTESENEIKEKALALESIKKWVEGKDVKKVIYVKNRVLNLVIN